MRPLTFWTDSSFSLSLHLLFSESSLSPTGSPSSWSSFLLERREPTKGGWNHSGPHPWPMESIFLPTLAGQALVFKRPKHPGDASEERVFPTLPPSSTYHSLYQNTQETLQKKEYSQPCHHLQPTILCVV